MRDATTVFEEVGARARPGHDQLALADVRPSRPGRRAGAARVHAVLSATRLGGARRRRDLGVAARHDARGAARPRNWHRRDIAAVGITNQRETTVLWDRATGEPVARAIVWQDRRTATACEQMRAAGLEPEIAARTGLLLDPYFSATKLAWLLDHVPGARARAERGELAFGTDRQLAAVTSSRRTAATSPTPPTPAARCCSTCGTARWDERLLEMLRRAARLPARGCRLLPVDAVTRSRSSSNPASNYR